MFLPPLCNIIISFFLFAISRVYICHLMFIKMDCSPSTDSISFFQVLCNTMQQQKQLSKCCYLCHSSISLYCSIFFNSPCAASHVKQEQDPEYGNSIFPRASTLLTMAYRWHIPPSFAIGNNARGRLDAVDSQEIIPVNSI